MNITEPFFNEEEIRLVEDVLRSKWVTQGPKTAEFEKLFSASHSLEHALATTSCTAALHLSALALDLKADDEVIVPAFTWITSANSAEYVGAKAVFADIDLDSFNLSPETVESSITKNTRAIVVVHLFGKAAPMDEILDIAKKNNLAVIEDAACAVGTTYKGKKVGGLGDLGCFSFHPRKVITTGEGGMVTTNNDTLANKIKALRNHGATGPVPGSDPKKAYAMGTFNLLGLNLRLSDIQSAIGVAQMSKLTDLLEERRRLALRYSSELKKNEKVIIPGDDPGHTYQSYVIRLSSKSQSERNSIMDFLSSKNIQTRPGTHAVHRLGYYQKKYKIAESDFPNACIAEDTSITLPIFPKMTYEEQDYVIDNLLFALGEFQ